MKKTIKTVEKMLTRRESLRLLGAAGATALVGLKGEPGQTNAVSHGCPPARFRNVTVLNTGAA